ncbi:MAG: hypothetical protein C0403_08525 [Desulfobacterium sp.]|nr:hypothetical protein [Desulfobacterium sp.]
MTIRYGMKLLLIMIAAGITGCGEPAAPPSLSLSGTVSGQAITDHPDKPILVAVIRGGDLNRIQTDPMGAIIAYIPVDHDQLTFRIDLTDKGLTAWDTVMLAAFVDMNYRQGLPYPDPGDFIGIYVNAATLSVGLQLQEGETSDIDIHIDREIFNFQAQVAGTVRGDDPGNLILIAYAGEFVSSDFSTLNPSAIIGYRQMDKSESSLEYELPILPYGYDAPIENVFILAWLDVDRNGLMNTGDKIGYHGSSSGLPAPLTILAGVNTPFDIDFYVDIITTDPMDQPADYEPIFLKGTVSLSPAVTDVNAPVFLIITDAANGIQPADMVRSVRYFRRLPTGQGDFDLDLSGTGLKAGDEIYILGLLDVDYTAGFPNLTPGDWVGLEISSSLSAVRTLTADSGTDIEIIINRKVFDFEAELRGTVEGSGTGDLYIIPYAGEINSLNMSAIDMKHVIGYGAYRDVTFPLAYSVPILPFGQDIPIENVYLMAIQDTNQNGLMDAGDRFGFHIDPATGVPDLLTIGAGVQTDLDIQVLYPWPVPSGHSIVLEGEMELPAEDQEGESPVFLLVTSGADLGQLFTDPLSAVAYFEKMPPAESSFSLDLSSTSLLPDSRIMVLALWDRDYIAGFPQPTPGDKIGIFQNKSQMSQDIRITDWPADPVAAGWEFRINRRIYNHDASLTFQLESDGSVDLTPGDELIFLAVQKGGVDDKWHLLTPPGYQITDTDYAVGMQKTVVNAENRYTVDILPAIYEQVPVSEDPFTISNVYLFVVLDTNRNGLPDTGEYVGFYWQSIWFFRYYYFPKTLNVADSPHVLDRTVLFSGKQL